VRRGVGRGGAHSARIRGRARFGALVTRSFVMVAATVASAHWPVRPGRASRCWATPPKRRVGLVVISSRMMAGRSDATRRPMIPHERNLSAITRRRRPAPGAPR
jgi:hypothetical protein